MGKGDKRRPMAISNEEYADRWEMAFGRKSKKPRPEVEVPYWEKSRYRGQYTCIHGVGHGNHVHGCDGCCARDDFPLKGMSHDES